MSNDKLVHLRLTTLNGIDYTAVIIDKGNGFFATIYRDIKDKENGALFTNKEDAMNFIEAEWTKVFCINEYVHNS